MTTKQQIKKQYTENVIKAIKKLPLHHSHYSVKELSNILEISEYETKKAKDTIREDELKALELEILNSL